MAWRRLAPLSVAASLLAGCAGGGHGTVSPAPATGSQGATARVQITIAVPRRPGGAARRTRYVSAATQSATVTVTPAGAPALPTVTVNCTSVCSAQAPAVSGANAIAVALYDAPNGGGNLLSGGTTTVNVQPGVVNSATVTFDAAVNRVELALSTAGISAGTPQDVGLTVTAKDVDGNTIIGPGGFTDANGDPVTLAITATQAPASASAVTLSTPTLAAPPAGPLTLHYNGQGLYSASLAIVPSRPLAGGTTGATLTATPTIIEYATGITPSSAPKDIALGADGKLWFTENATSRIGHLDPQTGAITEDAAGITPSSAPYRIALGPDGNVWFTEQHAQQIAKITPGGAVTEFANGITPYPTSCCTDTAALVTGPDGNVWFTENADRIGRITPAGSVTEFSAGITPGSMPVFIAVGSDGNLWFTESAGRVGRITPSGTVTEFATGITAGASPWAIASGPDGNLWFCELNGNRIGRITPSGAVTEFSAGISPGAAPYDIAVGADGNLWFTERNGNRIGRIAPDGTITEFSTGMTPGSTPYGITATPDGALWFTELSGGRIAKLVY